MKDTHVTENTASGRVAAVLADRLRADITGGDIPAGQYMPPVRRLARVHSVAVGTANRALKMLEAEGLLRAQPRQGYQVLAGAGDPTKGLPIAYVFGGTSPLMAGWDDASAERLLAAFSHVAAGWGWSMLAVQAMDRTPDQIMRQVQAARACGAVLDRSLPEIASRMKAIGMPVVVVDELIETADVDVVVQDGFLGGLLAAGHLARRGHRRIGWVGLELVGGHPLVLDRFGGAVAGLARFGLRLPRNLCVEVPAGQQRVGVEKARDLLGRPNRPTAVLTLWQDMFAAVVEAAGDCGLVIGRDIDVVGWCMEEQIKAGLLRDLGLNPAPPMVVWRMAEMASTAVARLAHRREDPSLPPVHLKVPLRLTGVALAGEEG